MVGADGENFDFRLSYLAKITQIITLKISNESKTNFSSNCTEFQVIYAMSEFLWLRQLVLRTHFLRSLTGKTDEQ